MVAGVFLRHRCLAAQATEKADLEGGVPTNGPVLHHLFTGIIIFNLPLLHFLHTTNPLNSFICDKQRPKNISNPSINSRIHSHSKHQSHDHYPYHHPSRPHRDQTVDPTPQFHNYQKPPHCDQHLDSIFIHPRNSTNSQTPTKINSSFSPKAHRPSQFRDLHHSFNPTCEAQSTKTYLQPQNLALTHDIRKKSQISQRRDLLATCPVIQPESDRVSIVDSPHKPNGIFIPQMGTRPNSNSKPKPSLPRNRPITLVDMMQFVSDWFDFEEILVDGSAESELSKNEIGDDEFCDVLGDKVVDCVDSVQEKVEEILVDEITVSENIAKIEEDLTKYEVGVFESEETIGEISGSGLEDSVKHEKQLSETNGGSNGNVVNENGVRDDDESMAVETQEISVESSTIDVYHPDTTISVQQQQAEPRSYIDTTIHVYHYDSALHVFSSMPYRSSVSYNAMMSGYLCNDDFDLAREVFDKMPERDLVSWNVMISGYLRNKNLSEARELFEAMTCRNVGSWNTMITGYAQSDEITLARNLFDRSPLDTIACDSVRFAEPVNDKIVLSVIGQIVSTLGFGFENVKTKGVRRRQWQIAWASLACHWTIVLVPLWLWVALRRDFSVGVYHSHKPNRGLRTFVVLLVHFPRASTELEVEFFSKKG